ncbi:MAG: hypothetical protein ACSLEN_09365 [Candidatus Malihini olakiniferum]
MSKWVIPDIREFHVGDITQALPGDQCQQQALLIIVVLSIATAKVACHSVRSSRWRCNTWHWSILG